MQYAKPKVYWLMLIGVIFSILNTTTSYAAPICPSGDKMYYVGANAPSGSTRLALSWTAGSTSRTFNFTDGTGTTMTVSFPLLVDLNSNYGGNPPFYGNINNTTQNALNLVHNSPAIKDNHTMTISVNRAVTKLSFVVQDLDSAANNSGQVAYQEQVDVSSTSGQLTYNTYYHTINASNNIVTAIRSRNCDLNGCNIDATWGAKSANSIFSITHSNRYTQLNSPHAVGYSDFYFCVTPPKLTTRKVLTGNRVETNDQFTIATTTGTTPVSSFTTTGTGSSLSSNSVTAPGLSTTATYTIAETIANTDGKGNLANYNTSYACTNANSSSATTMPSGSTTSFNLPTLTYGDDITCTITNTPNAYIFSGIIFNDNGGLTLTERQLTGTNTQYFNGVYDPTAGETGIYQTGLKVQLAKNCNTTTPIAIKTVDVNTNGTYSITATQTEMAGATNVCLIEQEPGGNLTTYPVDTTNNQLNINYVATTYNYPNLNFGEVSQNNAGLVLVKEQATNDCNITNTAMLGLTYNAVTQSGIDARKCVAYKITAYNRTNLTNGLTDIKITDALPKKGVNGSTVNSLLDNPLDTTLTNFKVDTANSVAIGANGTVVSDVQSLAKGASRSLYFNTKYDANSK
ncbi:hypothetical protein A9Z64_06415 [Moraxella osloensis]|uniref:SpaA-like prealbumin fold domain-containing protein n=1 Tax=Faucicola osloensis TaxID=34062 RepID=A0A378Q7B7_FAUOS|nr:hypothetical protein [Moraxella osloensis]AME01198.1 hypothetical protein AXE82_04985 [Moraxella osloensis]OBX56202.1 hypothetical protein A9Z64_06415 [Moraxella osloensis]QPT43069.1 hypothetical protein I6G27_03845 [Moraxella osloensis]STY96690.1 Uncharacterised protein [Moraxella osloensis]